MVNFRKNGVVSLWVCRERHANYERGFDPLKTAFGIEYYDVDSHEAVGDLSWRTQSLSNLLGQLSYSRSFVDAALRRAREMGVLKGRRAIALYDFAYDQTAARVHPPKEPVFLGVFEWNDEEDEKWFDQQRPKKATRRKEKSPMSDKCPMEKLLGQSPKARDVRRFMKQFGSPEIEEVADRWYHSFPARGLSLLFEEDELIAIQLFAQGRDGFAQYDGPMPDALRMSMTKKDVRSVLGKPNRVNAGSYVYEFADHKLHVEFAGPGGAISLLTVRRATG